jgi:hypothetical protein
MKPIPDSERKQTFANFALMFFLVFAIFFVMLLPSQAQKICYYFSLTGIFLSAFFCIDLSHRRYGRWIVGFAIILQWSYFLTDNIVLNFASKFVNILIYISIAFLLIKQVANAKSVNRIVILESVNGYMMLAMFYTIIIALIMLYNPEAFQFQSSIIMNSGDLSTNFNEYLYYGFNAFATVTYGDVMPVSPVAKSITMALSFTGQMYVAIIISMLVGKYITQEQVK